MTVIIAASATTELVIALAFGRAMIAVEVRIM